jgi:1-acyl-sn-glycerol-3-phosphate acyltransferase
LSLPIDLLYRFAVTHTIVLGRQHLERLPPQVMFAGTHHGYPDLPLLRHALIGRFGWQLGRRLMPATAAGNFAAGRWLAGGLQPHTWYGILALGTYPLRQLSEREASLRGLVHAAMAGNVIAIFPQGTHASLERERAGDPSVRFRAGVAHLAEALGAAVVPFGLAGTDAMIPPDIEKFDGPVVAGVPLSLARGALAINFGSPLTLRAGESPDEFTARLQDVCYSLTREAEQALAAQAQP